MCIFHKWNNLETVLQTKIIKTQNTKKVYKILQKKSCKRCGFTKFILNITEY